MISGLIDLLQLHDYYGVSKNIDIAKGLYSIPKTFSDGKKQLKRAWKSKR